MSERRDMDAPGAMSAPEGARKSQEMVDRWGEVHTVTWDAKRAMWAGALQGHGVKGEELRTWWPRDALKPFLLAPSDAHGASGAATSGPATIPADEIPF